MFARIFYRILAQCGANAAVVLTLIKREDVSKSEDCASIRWHGHD